MKNPLAAATLVFFLLLTCTNMYAQKLFSFDEMLTLSQYKTSANFEKTVLSSGYKKAASPKMPSNIKELHSYKDNYTYPNGAYNFATWIIFNDKNGLHKYVSFSFQSKEHYNKIALLVMERGYKLVKNAVKDAGNGGKAVTQFLRKGDSGIQLSVTDGITFPGSQTPTCETAFTTISTPNWPDDEK